MGIRRKIGFKDYFFFAEAWFWLAVSRIMLLFLPFKKLMKLFGTKPAEAVSPAGGKDQEVIQIIGIAIARACRYSFWRTLCFEQAIAAKMMLRSRQIRSTIFFGVKLNSSENKMNAHAWVESEGLIVTGAKGIEQFTVVSSFAN